MRKRLLATALVLSLALGGCARWEPEQGSPVKLTRACPLQRGPAVGHFADGGLQGVYHFVTQDAPKDDLAAFLDAAESHGFSVALMTLNMNGKDTLFAQGPAVLLDQPQVDAEFEDACALGRDRVYLTHVRYNPAEEQRGPLRVR